MRYIIALIFAPLIIVANNLEIVSNSFYYKDGEQKVQFNGNVIAKEGQRRLIKANALTIYLDKNNKAKKYRASGDIFFKLKNQKRYIKGRCSVLIYLSVEDKYILKGDVILEDILNKRKVYGDEIIIDNKDGSSYAKSNSKKLVKFIFKVKNK